MCWIESEFIVTRRKNTLAPPPPCPKNACPTTLPPTPGDFGLGAPPHPERACRALLWWTVQCPGTPQFLCNLDDGGHRCQGAGCGVGGGVGGYGPGRRPRGSAGQRTDGQPGLAQEPRPPARQLTGRGGGGGGGGEGGVCSQAGREGQCRLAPGNRRHFLGADRPAVGGAVPKELATRQGREGAKGRPSHPPSGQAASTGPGPGVGGRGWGGGFQGWGGHGRSLACCLRG